MALHQSDACLAAHPDELVRAQNQALPDVPGSVATLKVRQPDVPRQALLLRGAHLRAHPVLLQVAAERLVLVSMTQARRRGAQL